MRTIKGPGLFLAQFATDAPPHNTLAGIAKWAKDYGYKAIQIPTWDSRFFDLDRAYDSETYCDEIKGTLADIGIAISELSTHFQGQMVSVHPAYDAMFDGQCPAPCAATLRSGAFGRRTRCARPLASRAALASPSM